MKIPLQLHKLVLDEEGLKTPLHDGDVITFFPIKPSFDNSVTLKIMQSTPIRVPIGPTSRVKDVLPNKEAILTSEFFFRRFNVDEHLTSNEPELGNFSEENDRKENSIDEEKQTIWRLVPRVKDKSRQIKRALKIKIRD